MGNSQSGYGIFISTARGGGSLRTSGFGSGLGLGGFAAGGVAAPHSKEHPAKIAASLEIRASRIRRRAYPNTSRMPRLSRRSLPLATVPLAKFLIGKHLV